jgi:membrane protease YdiL (CAAX protease family)
LRDEIMNETTKKTQSSLSIGKYLIGLLAIYATAYSQYFLPSLNLVLSLLYVYGIPIVIVGIFWGRYTLRRFFNRMYAAVKYGFASYGGFTGLSYILTFIIILLIIIFDPSALNILNNPNPVLNTTPENAWIMVWVSLLVVGPAEEFIFRGFLFGGLLNILGNRHWISLAFLTSILFAAAHLYYALQYGIVSVIMFTQLIAFGMAMAVTYYLSNGNLLIPSFIHGLFDATGFLTTAVSLDFGATLRLQLFYVSLAVLGALLVQHLWNRGKSTENVYSDTIEIQ